MTTYTQRVIASSGRPQYQKYQDARHRPPFAWDGDAIFTFRIEHVIYPKAGITTDSDFTIAICRVMRDPESPNALRRNSDWTIPIKGEMPGAEMGKVLEGVGKFIFNEHKDNPRWSEWQISVDGVADGQPLSIQDIRAFLMDEIEEIGPKRAEQFLALWNVEALEKLDRVVSLIKTNPAAAEINDDVRAVRRIVGGKSKLEKFVTSFTAKRETFHIGRMIASANISGAVRRRVLAKYKGQDLGEALRDDPTSLLDIEGITFQQAYLLWMKVGLKADDIRIMAAGIAYVLGQHAQWGNCWTDPNLVFDGGQGIRGAGEVLNLPGLKARWYTEQLEQRPEVQRVLHIDNFGNFWPRRLYEAECNAAARIATLLAAKPLLNAEQLKKFTEAVDVLIAEGFKASPKQREAAIGAVSGNVAVITGSAGTGKTTIQKLITQALQRIGITGIMVVAPTGKAADNATMKIGVRARTIHKALELAPDGAPGRDAANPLDAKVVIVDELSMVDIRLFAWLVDAIKVGCMLIIVGDPEQLPAVGPGAVLRDIKVAGVIPNYHLTETFRQAADSKLLDLFYAVLGKEPMRLLNNDGLPVYPDIDVVPLDDPKEIIKWVMHLWNEAYQLHGRDTPNKIKFLTYSKGAKTIDSTLAPRNGKPAKRFQDAGVFHINEAMVNQLFPALTGEMVYKSGDRVFRKGQRCIWLTNTNDPMFDMTNGKEFDIADIYIEEATGNMKMEISTKNAYGQMVLLKFDPKQWDGDFMHAYCMTIHKAQGSEWDTVVFILRPGDERRVSLAAVYTALTRAAKKIIILGNPDCLWTAEPKDQRRQTGFAQRLIGAIKKAA